MTEVVWLDLALIFTDGTDEDRFTDRSITEAHTMRPTRAVLLVAATALTPALLFTAPALATGSPAPTATAEATGTRLDQPDDDRVAIARILFVATQNGDKRVIREANELLDDGTPDEMRAWLETGYRLAQAEDDAVYTARLLADPTISPALRAAANAALDDGTPEALRHFRETAQYEVAN